MSLFVIKLMDEHGFSSLAKRRTAVKGTRVLFLMELILKGHKFNHTYMIYTVHTCIYKAQTLKRTRERVEKVNMIEICCTKP